MQIVFGQKSKLTVIIGNISCLFRISVVLNGDGTHRNTSKCPGYWANINRLLAKVKRRTWQLSMASKLTRTRHHRLIVHILGLRWHSACGDRHPKEIELWNGIFKTELFAYGWSVSILWPARWVFYVNRMSYACTSKKQHGNGIRFGRCKWRLRLLYNRRQRRRPKMKKKNEEIFWHLLRKASQVYVNGK